MHPAFKTFLQFIIPAKPVELGASRNPVVFQSIALLDAPGLVIAGTGLSGPA
ncbi:hypothetical protein ACFL1Z_08660 [Thermodesulfobacteriota bacterium]